MSKLKQYRTILISILTVVTALIHLFIGIVSLGEGGEIFLLNFAGYLSLIAIFLYNKMMLEDDYWQPGLVLAIYAFVTFIAYFATWGIEPFMSPVDFVGIGTKLVELVLIGLLTYDYRIREIDAQESDS